MARGLYDALTLTERNQALRQSVDHTRLTEPVTIQSATVGGSYGGSDPDWSNPTTVASCRAEIKYLRGRELLDAKAVASAVQWRVRIRERTGITSSMRVVWGSRTLDIAVVDESPKRFGFIDLFCAEHAGQ